MIQIKVALTTVDGNRQVYPVTPKTQVEFERQHKIGIAKAFNQADIRMEYLYWLGWHASKLAGANPKPFDGWLDTVASIDIDDEANVPLDEIA